MTFSEALDALKEGKAVRLPHWKKDMRILLQTPDEHSKMSAPYIYLERRFGRVPWVVTQDELLSNVWEISTY